MDQKRVFIFVPGKKPQIGKYYLSGYQTIVESANISTIALVKLQERIYKKKPDLVLAFCTEGAKEKCWGDIKRSFDELGVKAECIPIPDGKNELELKEIIKIMLQKIPEACRLTLDLTHGFRSCPIVFSVAVQYIKLLRKNIEIEGFYYGMLENKNEAEESPIVDLKVYLDLMEWIYAVRVFRDTKVTSKLIEQFDKNVVGPSKEQIITNLQDFNKYYELAAPIKLGETAASLNDDLKERLSPEFLETIPLGEELIGEIAGLVKDFSSISKRKPGLKEELDIQELERQGRIADIYFETGQINHAVGLMREWIVSMLLYYNGNKAKWRERKERKENIEDKINKSQESDLKKRWDRVRKLRNELHHHGIQDCGAYSIDREIQLVKEDWNILKGNIKKSDYWLLGS